MSIAKGKEFYSALFEIVKKYLSERFNYDVLGKTDAELVSSLVKYQADQAIIDDVKAIVEGSEMIKFANTQAAQDQIDDDYERVVGIIKRTVPTKK